MYGLITGVTKSYVRRSTDGFGGGGGGLFSKIYQPVVTVMVATGTCPRHRPVCYGLGYVVAMALRLPRLASPVRRWSSVATEATRSGQLGKQNERLQVAS